MGFAFNAEQIPLISVPTSLRKNTQIENWFMPHFKPIEARASKAVIFQLAQYCEKTNAFAEFSGKS
jgi:hypothetical protein